jgi:hypothetical protein
MFVDGRKGFFALPLLGHGGIVKAVVQLKGVRMKNRFLALMMILTAASATASAQQFTGDVADGSTGLDRNTAQVTRDRFYGYSPRFLTGEGQYTSNAEEEGHYILGFSDHSQRPQPKMPELNPAQEPAPTPTAGVLVSPQRPQQRQSADEVPKPANNNPVSSREGRTNDSQDLQRVIDEHKWILPF